MREVDEKLKYQGKTKTLSQWAREFGLPRSALRMRLMREWPIEKALTTPLRAKTEEWMKARARNLAPQSEPWTFEALLKRYRGRAIQRAVWAGLDLADENLQKRYLEC